MCQHVTTSCFTAGVDTTRAVTAPSATTPRDRQADSIATELSLATERESIRSRTVRSITEEISALRSRRDSGGARHGAGRRSIASDSSIQEEEGLKK